MKDSELELKSIDDRSDKRSDKRGLIIRQNNE